MLTGCLQENPRFDLGTAGSSSGTGDDTPVLTTESPTDPGSSSSSGEPTTGVGTSSTGEPGSSSTGDSSSVDTTEGLEFPSCPYEPPGIEVSVVLSAGGVIQDETLRPCGDLQMWGPLLSEGFDALGHHFQRCADDMCGACNPLDRLDLGLSVPDPFGGGGPLADSCARLHVAWNRPVAGDAMLCRPSMVAIVEIVGGVPEAMPATFYRHTQVLPTSDIIGAFELKAAVAGPGMVECPCEGDCCREDPGSRPIDFTLVVSGDAFKVPTIESQQAVQDIEFGAIEGSPATAHLALVRSFFPSTCLEPPQHEWLFARTL